MVTNHFLSEPLIIKYLDKNIVMKRFTNVDDYIAAAAQWEDILHKLRELALMAGLTETVKWGGPCYTHLGKMVCSIGAFNHWACLWFYQGVFLKDPKGVLINANEANTKGLRQWRIKSMEELHPQLVLDYMLEAKSLTEAGIAIKADKDKPIVIPMELQKLLDENEILRNKFEALSKSARREYAEYITEAKRAETKQNRLEKIAPMILEGKGLHDKYK